jgi:hypothetical protein
MDGWQDGWRDGWMERTTTQGYYISRCIHVFNSTSIGYI